MKLTLLSPQEYTTIVLPEKCVGHYWVRGRDSAGKLSDIIAVEAEHFTESEGSARWILKSNRRFRVMDSTHVFLNTVPLRPMELYRIESVKDHKYYVLFTEPLSDDRRQYSAYELTDGQTRLTIGRSLENNIIYDNRFVSSIHAELTFVQDRIQVRDLDSVNKTYVNGKTVTQAELQNGDVLYIMGLRIVVIGRYLFLNHPDHQVTVRGENLRQHHVQLVPPQEDAEDLDEDIGAAEDYYYRSPRFKHNVDTFELKMDPPPAPQSGDELPLIMMIGPSVTMGMASVATGLFAVTNAMSRGDISAALPSIVMSVSMLMGTLMWPLVTKFYQRKLRVWREAKRQETYRAYLAKMEQIITKEIQRQELVLRENALPTPDYAERILAQPPQIWERTRKHSDFLSLRLGCGSMPMKEAIQYPERRFTVEQDDLAESIYQFGERERTLSRVPICLSLVERFVSGVYARQDRLIAYAKSLILQITALHAYDEVKLVLIYDETISQQLAFARWLPHVMNNERTVRYIATNSDEAKALSSSLDAVIEYRKSISDSQLEDAAPYYVILCLDKEMTAKTECVRRIQEHKENLKFSVLAMCEQLQDLPKECSAVVELREDGSGALTLINDVSAPPIAFQADSMGQIDFQKITQVLANTEIDLSCSSFALPKTYTFFEMLDIGMVEHLNLLERWTNNDPTKSLAAPIGIDKYGEPFKLDLHQEAHGPHGLVAGMTGSGKSETIISYILSMAVNFHPYEVAFILIDYKGGGMAKSFEHIPHTAGVITNLDGNGIQRSLASMRSELHRRERIFGGISQQYNISNIDIYKYQKLYREGRAKEPLPHLFIISDEFAELKKEQPDFMTELTSTARVGRSLGVHLILATQKPGGIVDDQIRSNSRFKICLKVQDSGDSMEMLGCPDAAALVDTGRFYLQVGYNELFQMGQSAWAGAPYYPSPKTIKNRDDAVSVIDTNGRVLMESNINRFAMFRDPQKQLDVVTEYIRSVCEEEGIRRWKMWLDPIPALIYVDELMEKYPETQSHPFVLNPVAGEYDDPTHQTQGLLRVPISEKGNVIVYGSAGNGKAMFLEAVCYSLMRQHTPQEVSLYILDFGAETMSAFAEAPHVGDVVFSHETEKVSNLFKLLLGKLDTRKKLLSQFGGDITQYNVQTNRPEPNMVVMINNFAAFSELYEDILGDINYLTREGTKYGIYFILTCTGVNNVRLNLRQNFASLYCLQLNSNDDYSTVVEKTSGLYPEKFKGRGLIRLDKDSLFEFQTARVTAEDPPYHFIRSFARQEAAKYVGTKAVRVPVLPEEVTEEFLFAGASSGDLNSLPIGVEKETLELARYNFAETPVTLLLAMNQEWQRFADTLSQMVASRCGVKTMLISPNGRTGVRPIGENLRVFTDANSCAQAVRELFSLVLTRNNTYKDALEAGETPPSFEPLLVVIESMSQLKAVLDRIKPTGEKEADDDTLSNRLQLAMEKCESTYGIYFVVAESLNALTPLSAEGWYRNHITGSMGLWIGSGLNNQYRLNVHKKPPEAAKELSTDFGFVVHNGAAVLVKFLQ